MKGLRATAAASALLLTAFVAPSRLVAQTPSEAELTRVRAGIAELERELERQVDRRDDGMAELRSIELRLAETGAELQALAASIATQSERRTAIAAEQRAATARLEAEQSALAEQVRMSYMTGRQELVRLLLNQDSPADVGRMLVYYDYLNRHRGEQIDAVDGELERLAELARESEAAARELERLQAEQEARAARLESQQAERQALIAELDAAIESSGDRIERMRAEEAELNETVARLAEILEDFPVNSDAPFPARRGDLAWPVEGRVAARFGDPRDDAGLVRWDGVLLEAAAGTPVRAVYHGRVIHAQWHTHMGLLLILDHGDGHWSLYGHNRALLRERDDRVSAGDVIAEVGNTGGRVESALYFSILEDGQPVDPADWVR